MRFGLVNSVQLSIKKIAAILSKSAIPKTLFAETEVPYDIQTKRSFGSSHT